MYSYTLPKQSPDGTILVRQGDYYYRMDKDTPLQARKDMYERIRWLENNKPLSLEKET